MTTTNTANELTILVRCLGYAESQAMRTRTECDYRTAARYAMECAAIAPYAARRSYLDTAARWRALANDAANEARDASIDNCSR
jgi:hypothetical protein